MNILLINPPRFNEVIANNPEVLESERGFNPPLGLLYLAGYLKKHSEYNVDIIDSQVERLDYTQLKNKIIKKKPDVVGITVMTLTLLDSLQTARIVKSINKSIKVVFGGPHVHLYPEETIKFDHVDFLVLGEGEKNFKILLDNINDIDELTHNKGFVFIHSGKIVNTGVDVLHEDLDSLPFPARELTPYKKYSSLLAKRTPITTIFTSRGCPYKCRFCDRPHLGTRFRAHSADYVVREIQECLKLGIHEFLVYDDTFTIDRNRVIEICKRIVDLKLDVGFDIRSRINTIDEEQLKWLKRANCRGIHYGIEAGTKKILRVLNKGITLNAAKKIIDLTKKYKIQTLSYFMIGSPTETKEDILTTFKVMRWLNTDFTHLTILCPFPGTQIYFDGLEKGIIKSDVWRNFSNNPIRSFIPPYWSENFELPELQELLKQGYQKFYMRGNFIFRKLLSLSSFGEFARKFKAGLKLLFMK